MLSMRQLPPWAFPFARVCKASYAEKLRQELLVRRPAKLRIVRDVPYVTCGIRLMRQQTNFVKKKPRRRMHCVSQIAGEEKLCY